MENSSSSKSSSVSSLNSSNSANPDKSASRLSDTKTSQSLSLRFQKKMASKFATGMGSSKRMTKLFINDSSANLYDNMKQLIRLHSGSKAETRTISQYIFQINIKLGVLYMNKILSQSELEKADQYRDRIHCFVERLVNLSKRALNGSLEIKKGKTRTSPKPISMSDIESIIAELILCESILVGIIGHHLSEKSRRKIKYVLSFFTDVGLYKAILIDCKESYTSIFSLIIEDLEELLDKGFL